MIFYHALFLRPLLAFRYLNICIRTIHTLKCSFCNLLDQSNWKLCNLRKTDIHKRNQSLYTEHYNDVVVLQAQLIHASRAV